MNFEDGRFAYWVGLTQADGSLKSRRNGSVSLEIEVKDKILAEAFRDACNKFFGKDLKVFRRTDGRWCCGMGVKKLLKAFESLDLEFKDPPSPPLWFEQNMHLFGAYIAGVIDGDGNIRIKRPEYPQCVVRVTSGSKQSKLLESLSRIMRCAVTSTKRRRTVFYDKESRFIDGTWYDLEFLVSSKNMSFMKSFVLPFILLKRKQRKIENYIRFKEHN